MLILITCVGLLFSTQETDQKSIKELIKNLTNRIDNSIGISKIFIPPLSQQTQFTSDHVRTHFFQSQQKLSKTYTVLVSLYTVQTTSNSGLFKINHQFTKLEIS